MMESDQAAQTLAQLERVRARTRADLGSMWFPLVVFGMLTLVSSAVMLLAGPRVFGLYWTVAGIAGGIVVGAYYALRQHGKGVLGPTAAPLLIAMAILVGALGLGWYGGIAGAPLVAAAGPPLVVAVGYLAFAWLERDALLAATAVGLAALTGILLAAGLDARSLTVALAIAYGAVLAGTGLAYRLAGR